MSATDERQYDDLPPLESEGGADGLPAASDTLLDQLLASRAQTLRPHTYDFDVPGWGGGLVLRLGAIPSRQLQRLTDRATRSRDADKDTRLHADTLIAALRAILLRDPRDGSLHALTDADGIIDDFGERAAGRLRLGPVGSARDVVTALFQYANSPSFALAAASNDWVEWAKAADADAEETYVGESGAPRR